MYHQFKIYEIFNNYIYFNFLKNLFKNCFKNYKYNLNLLYKLN